MTQAEWVALGLENPSVHQGLGGLRDCSEGNCPVGNLNWYEAHALANRMSDLHSPPLPHCYLLEECTSTLGQGLTCTKVGQTVGSVYDCTGFRVPTEAEWEYAARAGTRTAFYSGGLASSPDGCTSAPSLDGIAWYCANGSKTTHPVGGKECNAWGVCDILGNAGEWVSDKFDGLGYGAGPRTDPGALVSAPVKNEGDRIFRGGSFNGRPSRCRSASRYQVAGFERGPGTGVRLVRTLP